MSRTPVEFNNRVLMVGFGSVAQCALPILVKHLRVPLSHITVLDFEDRGPQLEPWVAQGVRFVRQQITPDNLGTVLGQHLKAGDLLIDLAWNIDCCEILRWCHDQGVLYINTSVEVWDPYDRALYAHPTQRTLYWRHQHLQRLKASWSRPGTTAVVEHGANPGLISHFTKQALLDIGERLLSEKRVQGAAAEQIAQLMSDRVFNRLAMQLGVKVIHCSERDTQISDRPKEVDEFVNTWSVEGFREEGTTTAEMGWGTHEKELPPLAYEHQEGPRNQICMASMGINTWVRSWVPDYTIRGMVVRHGEAYTISDRLTVWARRQTPLPAHGPLRLLSVRCGDRFAQRAARLRLSAATAPADHGRRDHQRRRHPGALLMGHAFNSWWTGSDLSIEQSRRLVPHQNATTVQVAIAVVAAVMWMIDNPQQGVCVPDELPHDYVLDIAKPYLGKFISTPSDWTPLQAYTNVFDGYTRPSLDLDDPWQFKNFLVWGRD